MEATLNKNENYTWKFVNIPGNIMEFCHRGKMGTLGHPWVSCEDNLDFILSQFLDSFHLYFSDIRPGGPGMFESPLCCMIIHFVLRTASLVS